MEDATHTRSTLAFTAILGSLSVLAVQLVDFGDIIPPVFLATGIVITCIIGTHLRHEWPDVGKNSCRITAISPTSVSVFLMPGLANPQPGRPMPKPSVGIPMTISIWIGRATMRNRY
ncbi:hypothetical protein ACJ7V3_13635 [Halomonas elongata]|uniref:hypothetical protein n=1 Tax=Halomonas elongata TaxID=2746 RepID=UPI0038D484DB